MRNVSPRTAAEEITVAEEQLMESDRTFEDLAVAAAIRQLRSEVEVLLAKVAELERQRAQLIDILAQMS